VIILLYRHFSKEEGVRRHLKAMIVLVFGEQSRFAAKIGKSDNFVSRIVQGRQAPTKAEKDAILRALGLDQKHKGIFEDLK
jgi:transcriptional regulator with XRE-family HTH domain